ncbi:amidohydrolase family protein, partial [Candidatus Bipolaricaulota bacterium]|nr:amidohydrolase family protein [Candidatus Bipolaricaulota bacterium]
SHSYSTARRWVYEGVTTVRDLGVPWGSVDWNAVGERYDADPRMPLVLWSGPLITVPNGYPIAGSNFSSLAVLSPEDARTQTLALIEQGVDVIKVALAIGHGIPDCLSLEEIEAIVDVAHEHGLRVTAHATTLPAAQRALEAGVDELAHSLGLNLPRREVSGVGDILEAWINEMLVDNNISWTPTLAIMGEGGGSAVVEFLRAGGTVAMGNDAGYLQGVLVGMPMNEIRAMETAGMTPMEIIVASTSSAARVCQIDATLGVLRAGMQADILVVAGNPLEDLEVLDDALLVYHRGVLVRDSR